METTLTKRPEIETYVHFTAAGPVLEITRTYGEDQMRVALVPQYVQDAPRKQVQRDEPRNDDYIPTPVEFDPHWHG